MRANWEVAAFINWLKDYNESTTSDKRIGFSGLDVFSFRESMQSILQSFKQNDPEPLVIAKKAMECFEPFGKEEGQSYGKAASFTTELCEKEILTMCKEILKNILNYNPDAENVLSTEQKAYVSRNAAKIL